jgi:hypothetical protein
MWKEPAASWSEPVYPDEIDEHEDLSPPDEEESYSDFVPSESASE